MRLSFRISIAALLLGLLTVMAVALFGAGPRAALGRVRNGRPAVLVIHGGAWHRVGAASVRRMAPDAARLRSWGYRTYLVNYRAGAHAFPDVMAAYQRLRRRVGKKTPICAYGASAGAHMALMLAIRRPQVACVIGQAPPTLLAGLPRGLRRLARIAFGAAGGLDVWSPAEYRLRTPALIEQGRTDHVVPLGDSCAMHAADPNSELRLLPPGPEPWTHTSVSPAALRTVHRDEHAFIRRAVARWIARGPAPRATFVGR